MALNAKKIKNKGVGRKFPPIDEGTYPTRLVQVIDLGLQPQSPYRGQEKPPVNEIMLTYEFLDEFLPDENGEPDENKPRWYSETMPFHNLEADKAKSTKRYYALDPKEEHEGDWSHLLGTPCMVTIVHNPRNGEPDNPYANIGNVSSMRPKEAAKAPELVNPPKFFDTEEPDLEMFFSLPEWLQAKIKENLNYEGSTLEKAIKNYKKPDKEEKKNDKKKPAKEEPEEEEGNEEEDGEGEPW